MFALTLNQLLGLFIAFLGIFPSILLFRLYIQTKISDYFLFALFFLIGDLILIFDPLAGVTNLLLFYQLHHLTITTAFFILFIHACRMSWKRIPKIIIGIGTGYYIILVLLILLWKVQTQPTYATVLFFYLPHDFSTYFPQGAGLVINGIYIYSTGFSYIEDFYRVFSLCFLFYAYYFKTRPLLKERDNKIIKARYIWLLIWTLFLFHTISLFPWFLVSDYESLFLILAALLIFYITIFLPEGLLLSSAQLTRILPLYKLILKQSEKNPRNSTVELISTYLTIINEIDELTDK